MSVLILDARSDPGIDKTVFALYWEPAGQPCDAVANGDTNLKYRLI